MEDLPTSGPLDHPLKTELILDNNKLILEKDPLHHGFWRIHFAKGQVPSHLTGRYTSHRLALAAADHYLASKKRAPVAKSG